MKIMQNHVAVLAPVRQLVHLPESPSFATRQPARLAKFGVFGVASSLVLGCLACLTGLPSRSMAQATPTATSPAPPSGPKSSPFGNAPAPPITPEQREKDEKATALNQEGAKALDAGDYVTAEKDARQAYEIGDYRDLLAQVLYAEGKTEEAYRFMSEHRMTGGFMYALLALKNGQWEQAVEVYDNAMDGIGESWKSGGAIPSRLGILQQIYERYPHFDARDYRPKLLETAMHLALGIESKRKQAPAEYQQALALNPSSDITNYYVGYGWQQVGENAKAQAAYQKAITLGKGSVKEGAEKGLAVVTAKIAKEQAAQQAAAQPTNPKVAKTGN